MSSEDRGQLSTEPPAKTHLRTKRKSRSEGEQASKKEGKRLKPGRRLMSQSAQTELLHYQEQPGQVDLKDVSHTTQQEIKKCAPPEAQLQSFELNLDHFGPYCLDYSANGRYLLLGGKKGHLALMDWRDRQLTCEVMVQEMTRDVSFLHNESMFAAAQKRHLFIYDNTGCEIHCVKLPDPVHRLAFLPYHFLLVLASEGSLLSFLDVSVGKMVAQHSTKLGPLKSLSFCPSNGVAFLGHQSGTVSLWTPNLSSPVVKMLCHRGPITSLALDHSGRHLVTAGMDAQFKIWDLRNYQLLHAQRTAQPAASVSVSQRNLVAAVQGRQCCVWTGLLVQPLRKQLLLSDIHCGVAHAAKFCPYEDCLGIGHSKGFSSIIVPGAGEANYDALEANPFQSKSQRREMEVQSLLGKVPAELIALDSDHVSKLQSGKEHDKSWLKAEPRKVPKSSKSSDKSTQDSSRSSILDRFK